MPGSECMMPCRPKFDACPGMVVRQPLMRMSVKPGVFESNLELAANFDGE
jgi:hypothetical protein